MRGTSGFVPWGTDHQAVVFLTAVTAAAIILNRQHLEGAVDCWIRRGLAAVLVGNELLAWGISLVHGQLRLPLQLCDLALFAVAWALVSAQRSVAEVAYFWGLAGSLQAVLTPDLRELFPSYWWMKFFLGHCGVVLGAVYVAARGFVQPTAHSVWRVWLLTNGYAVVAGITNWLLGTNYGYLAHKPMHPSLLDHLGPWPYYIVGMEVVALASFYVYYAPLAWARWWQRRTT